MAQGYWNRIVQINVSEQYAPQPDLLQQKAAIVSQDSTTITPGTAVFIADPTALAPYLNAATAIDTMAWLAGVATITFASAHGIAVGDTTPLIVTGCDPSGYDGYYIATASTTTALTYAVAADPGASVTEGSAYFGAAAWLQAADATWWAQNAQRTGYFLVETGESAASAVCLAIDAYITANPRDIYNWCLLPGIDANKTQALALFNQYNALTSLVKFYMPVTVDTYADWATEDSLHNVFAMIQSPTYSAGVELDSVAYAAFITNINPTPTNKLPPSSYAYLYGVTKYPVNNTLMNEFSDGNINFVSVGAEGGISNTILVLGDNLDGTPQNVAYSIDWQQIQLELALANAVINGSNSQINPLYYNQSGIDRLQSVAGATAARGIATGLALGQVVLVQLDPTEFAKNLSNGVYRGNYVINAVPFSIYTALNPSDYSQGLYGGFQASFVPQYGFKRIVFNLEATQFA